MNFPTLMVVRFSASKYFLLPFISDIHARVSMLRRRDFTGIFPVFLFSSFSVSFLSSIFIDFSSTLFITSSSFSPLLHSQSSSIHSIIASSSSDISVCFHFCAFSITFGWSFSLFSRVHATL